MFWSCFGTDASACPLPVQKQKKKKKLHPMCKQRFWWTLTVRIKCSLPEAEPLEIAFTLFINKRRPTMAHFRGVSALQGRFSFISNCRQGGRNYEQLQIAISDGTKPFWGLSCELFPKTLGQSVFKGICFIFFYLTVFRKFLEYILELFVIPYT